MLVRLPRFHFKLLTLMLLVALSAVATALYVRRQQAEERRRFDAAFSPLPRGENIGGGPSPFDVAPSPPANRADARD